ncbi:ABC transporter permease [Exiguobacterium sp. SH3S2]|uniref:ABC transporter permease n=1 Tax=unclassified Exiguobacterium TaxID=2644629 RepID=UPI00103E36A3|nr:MULTISPECIES: ABC transporter permease [unclassified Exiguobacterium]TCI25464.1 ABC transporter permease [Exiguobacterium sp. SH5S4]TCI44149.1 ABC transporter permease [Exiguobacterium sp. SH3S3]TCI53112.1 ABC transporter permease [Exiguobacterium sp. SH5S13]TCI59606.1 ABC transporter permease [Exiguobacterium sp. SH3S2]TCI59923.1 ABC transporter permease [Exiguobacterium sp. SH3S1]
MRVFNARFSSWMEEVVKYSRYVANGGLLFTLYFTLIYGGFVYNQFLNGLDPAFPSEWIVALVFLFLPLGHRPRTLLQEADQVFLLPELGDIRSYMNGVRLFNVVFASVRALVVMLVVLPLIVRTQALTPAEVGAIVAASVLLSVAGRLAKLELISNVVLFSALASGVIMIFGVPLLTPVPALVALVLLHLRRHDRIPLLDWLTLEQKSKAQFDRVISWFVDLPAMREEVKERSVIVRTLERSVLRRADAARYVYGLRVIRSKDSLDLVFRLSVVAFIVMWLSGGWYVGLVVPLFVGLTALQLVPLFKRLDTMSIASWLPITRLERLAGYKWWMNRLLIGQLVVLTVGSVVFGARVDAVAGVVLGYLVIRYYLGRLK